MDSSDSPFTVPAHILVVEDEERVAEMIADSLRDAGYGVGVCHTGKHSMEYVRQNDVDMVLLDVILGDTDGITLARDMKQFFGADGFVPVLMLSGLTSEQDKVDGLLYADEYMTKPFAQDELLARIRALLRIRQLQRQLLVSRNRYRFLYQNIPEMCVSLDSSRRVWDCNLAFSRTYGLATDRIVGKSLLELFDPSQHKDLGSYLDSLKHGRVTSRQSVYHLLAAEESDVPIQVRIRGVQLGADEGGPSSLLLMEDVSHSLQLEEEQKVARRQLYRSARMVSIGTLASGVAHELNNPLAAILGFSDALLHRLENKEPLEEAEMEQYLGIIRSESLRCRDIIDNLLRFSRDREAQMHRMSLADCIRSACSLIGAGASKKRVSIENEVPADIVVRADPQRLGQVFLNVLANAIDFSPEGESVTIGLQAVAAEDRFVRVRISDTGPGIEASILSRVFDPFFTTKEVGQGTGLGLAICHRAMEECEGSIDIVSEKGKGTTVILDIPKGDALE
jgi:PAS domain S-box-containing protein